MSELVSIIVPVYNAADHLSKCLGSLCCQTYDNIEVLLVNDGSTDQSPQIMEDWAQRYSFIRIISQENKGVSSARNTGMRQAGGEYLLFVDSDDCISPDYTEKLISSLEQTGSGMAVCGFRSVYEDSGMTEDSSFAVTGVQSRDTFIEQILRFRDITSALWNKAFISSIIREKGLEFSEELAIGEDLCFLVDYALNIEKVSIIPDHLYDYLINPNGAMSARTSSFQKKWLTEWYAIQYVEKKLKSAGIHAKNLTIKKIRIANKLLSKCIETGYNDKAVMKQFSACLRKGLMTALRSDDFNAKKKLSIVLNAFLPGLRSAVNKRKKS